MTNFDIHEWNKKRYLAEQQESTTSLSQLTFDQISSVFSKDLNWGGVSFPLEGDVLRKVRNKEDFEEWKKSTMSRYGDVQIKLNPQGDWFNKIEITDDKFIQKQNQAIQSKSDFLDTMGGSKD